MRKRIMTFILAVATAVSLCACDVPFGHANMVTQGPDDIKSAGTGQDNGNGHSGNISNEEKENLAAVSEAAYQDFFEKKNSVSYTGSNVLYVTDGMQYRIYDLINSCNNCSAENYETLVENTEIYEQRIDIGNDGIPELALRISNETPNMGQVNYVFVIKYVDGELKILSTAQGAYRSFAQVNEDGVVIYGGSSGASAYFESFNYVSPDGKDAAYYSLYVDMYAQKAIVPWHMLDECPEDYPKEFGDEADDIVMKAYTLGREEGAPVYVVFEDQEGNSVPAVTGYEKLWEENGIQVVSQKEAEQKIQDLLDTVEGKYESDQANELSWETLDMEKYENIYGEDWITSYSNFLGNPGNYKELITDPINIKWGYFPAALSGFTLADVDGNDIPELILLMTVPDFTSTQVMNFYTYDETSGKVEWCRRLVSNGSNPGQYCTQYFSMPTDSFSYKEANDRYCLAGVADGKIITFNNYGDGYMYFEMAAFNLKMSDEEEDYEIIYNECLTLVGPQQFESYGDEEEAKKVLDEMDYLYFVEINSENIGKYVSEDYRTKDLHGRSDEDAGKMHRYFSEDAVERMNSVTWYNGTIEEAEEIGYSFEQMTQGWYSNF